MVIYIARFWASFTLTFLFQSYPLNFFHQIMPACDLDHHHARSCRHPAEARAVDQLCKEGKVGTYDTTTRSVVEWQW